MSAAIIPTHADFELWYQGHHPGMQFSFVRTNEQYEDPSIETAWEEYERTVNSGEEPPNCVMLGDASHMFQTVELSVIRVE
jgi:hypothetical protein